MNVLSLNNIQLIEFELHLSFSGRIVTEHEDSPNFLPDEIEMQAKPRPVCLVYRDAAAGYKEDTMPSSVFSDA